MNKTLRLLAPLAFALVLSCSDESTDPAASQPVSVNENIVNTDATLAETDASALAQGTAISVAFQSETATLQLGTDADSDPIIALTEADGSITYFRKSTTIQSKATLDEFLQGVWEAFARYEGGVHFELDVDADNNLTLVIAETEAGIQVDVRIQGTPSEQEVAEAVTIFQAWQANVSSSSAVASSSSVGTTASSSSSASNPMSSAATSSSSMETTSSSSSVTTLSSSSTTALSSSSSVTPLSSSSTTTSSSSAGGSTHTWCDYDMYLNYFTTSSSGPSWPTYAYTYTKMSCTEGFVVSTKNTYAKITYSDSPESSWASIVTVAAVNSDGGLLADKAACTATAGDGVIFDDNARTFTKCVAGLGLN